MGELSVSERVRKIAESAAIDHGLELVHTEVVGLETNPIVRIYIDKPNGVTHEDCADLSLHIGTILDVEDFIHSAYTLEVSSPGLERGLYSLRDYERFVGSLAKLRTRAPFNNQRNFRGMIAGLDGTNIIFEDRTSGRLSLPFEEIAKANLELNVEEELRKARLVEAAGNDAGAKKSKRRQRTARSKGHTKLI